MLAEAVIKLFIPVPYSPSYSHDICAVSLFHQNLGLQN